MSDQIKYDWKDVGKMTIDFNSDQSADISFYPSEDVIKDTLHNLAKPSLLDKIFRAINLSSKV